MEDNKTYFQNVSARMENALQRYKNEYPKNFGQILRHNYGKIALGVFVFLTFACLFSWSMKLLLLQFVAGPGTAVFVSLLHRFNKGEKEEEVCSYEDVQAEKAKLEPLLGYPDVQKYSEGFAGKLEAAAAEKRALAEKFKSYTNKAIIAAIVILAVLMLRGETLNKIHEDDSLFSDSEKRGLELAGIKEKKPFCTLTPLNQSVAVNNKKLEIYYTVNREYNTPILDIAFSGLKIAEESNEKYLLTITDKDGKTVPRSPAFLCSKTDEEVYSCDNYPEFLRTVTYLKKNQKNLRFKLEKTQE